MPAPAAVTRNPMSKACGRSTFTRVLWVHQRLGGGRPATAISLARELEVSDRTIKRDIEWMRAHLGADIVWEPATHSYRCHGPVGQLPLLRLDADEALALMLASQAFAAWGGSPLGRALTAALGKVTEVVGSAVSLPASEIARVVFQPDSEGDTGAEQRWFATLVEAIRARAELQLTYRKPGAKRPGSRTVHPLHLAYLDHRWMLLAHDPQRRASRNFLLVRIEAVRATGRAFSPPAGFDARAHLAGSFGLYTGAKTHEVRILFDAHAAPFIRERQWHPSQQLHERPRGRIEATYRLNHLMDIRRWILSWGSHAEALAPAELRRTIRKESAIAAARHARPARK